MRTVDAAQRWATTWQAAWERLDTEAIVALYADEAVLSTEPYREPYFGREGVRTYISGAFAEEEDVQALIAEPLVDGDRAAVAWWTSLREDGADATLAGTSLLRFNADGLVVEQWDTWNLAHNRQEPPEWAPFG